MDRAKLEARVQGQKTDDLLIWADTAASGMQRYLDDFRRTGDVACLAEVKLAALTMDAVVDEVAIRMEQYRAQLARQQQAE